MSNKKSSAPLIVVVLAAAAGAGWFLLADEPPPPVPVAPRVDPKDRPEFASDAERRRYVEEHMSVSEVSVDPDTKPDNDGEVPGLLRVTGKVHNNGEHEIKDVRMVLFMLGETEEPLGTFLENVLGKRVLPPGESRDFKFTIPDKKGYSGRFRHKLR